MDEKDEILIIDDDEGTRKTLTLILKKKGFEVVTAGTGEEGLKQAQGRKISVALLDINLPDIEGIRLITPLKEMHPGLSVIMITGYASMENAMRALNEGATGYILKPVKIDEILSKINDALERQHLIKNKELADEALRVSEEKYRNLVENINDIIYALDERGVIAYVSPAIEKISGYLPSELTGHPFFNFIHKDDMTGVIRTFEAAKSGKIASYEFRIVSKSGDERWLSSSSNPRFTNGEFSGLQGVLSDITERKRAVDALQKSEEKFRDIFDKANDAIEIFEIDDSGRPDRYIDINDVGCRMLQYSKEEILQHSPLDFDATDYNKPPYDDIGEKLQSAGHATFETGHKRKDGEIIPVEVHLHVITLLGKRVGLSIVRDISERKRADDALRKSEEKFRIVADNTYDWEYWIAPDGTYTYMSPSCERITGYSAHDFYKKPALFDEIVHPDDTAAYRGHIDLSYVSLGPESVDYRIIRKDGSIRWISHICQPMYGDDGKLVGRRSSNRDVTERHLAEMALRESEEKFRAFFATSMDCVFITTLDGKWVDFNDAAITFFGYGSREELLSVAIRDLYADPASRDAHIRHIRDQGHSLEYPVNLRKKDGTVINTLITSVVRSDSEGNFIGFQGTIRDITERKQAEETLRASEHRHATLLSAIPDMMFVISRDGVYRDFSVPDSTSLAIPADQIIGKNIRDTGFKKEPTDAILQHIAQAIDTDTLQKFEYELQVAQGVRQYEARLVALSEDEVLGIVRDITERKQAEEALRESEQKFRDMFENSRDGIVIADNTTRNLIDGNETFSQMLGYSPEEIKKLGVKDLHPKDSLPQVYAAFEKMVQQGSVISDSLPVKRKDGAIFYADISAYPITIANKRYLVGVFRDITERRQAEEFQRHFTEKLEQQVRSRTQELEATLNEKVVLLREVHHRVKNNLQIIISLVNLQMRKIEDPQLKQVMAETQNRVRAMSLVHEKLYQSESLSRIDFADYTRFLTTQLMSYYRTDTRKVQLDFTMDTIMVDINTAVPLGLLMNELISNAFKHAFPDGREGTISISGREENNRITLVVRDNGIGIPDELDWKDATSLGMVLITSLVDQIDGTITLDRKDGTTFTITVKINPASGETG